MSAAPGEMADALAEMLRAAVPKRVTRGFSSAATAIRELGGWAVAASDAPQP